MALLALVILSFSVFAAKEKEDLGQVLSEKATITASSAQMDKEKPENSNSPEKAVDGDVWETRWAAVDGTYPQWLKIDLGADKNISMVYIKFYKYTD